MKRLLICFFILAFVSSLNANTIFVQTPAGGCSYVLKDESGTPSSSNSINLINGTYLHGAVTFEAGSSYTAKQIKVILSKVGSPTGTLSIWLVDDTGGYDPEENGDEGSVQSDQTLNVSTLTTGYVEYTFTFTTGKALTSTVDYWIKASIPDGSGDTSNYIKWERDAAASSGNGVERSADDAPLSWASLDSDGDGTWKLYSCE